MISRFLPQFDFSGPGAGHPFSFVLREQSIPYRYLLVYRKEDLQLLCQVPKELVQLHFVRSLGVKMVEERLSIEAQSGEFGSDLHLGKLQVSHLEIVLREVIEV